MTDFSLSLHIDRPARLRALGDFSAAMQEVTQRTAHSFGGCILGLHTPTYHQYCSFGSVAHQRDAAGNFIYPANPENRLLDAAGKPLPDAMQRTVAGLLLEGRDRRADDHAYFAVGAADFAQAHALVIERQSNPPAYHAIKNNCVKFALTVLGAAGIELDTSRLRPSVAQLRRPEDISTALAHQPQRADTKIIIATPLLLGR